MNAHSVPNDPGQLGGGAGPPYDESMDRRLVVLETRFDVILPTLATKHDLELLRGELKDHMNASIENLRRELIGEIDKRTGELTGQIDKLRQEMATMLKWVIALFISTMIAFSGTTLAMIHAIKAVPPARTASAAPLPSLAPAPAPLSR